MQAVVKIGCTMRPNYALHLGTAFFSQSSSCFSKHFSSPTSFQPFYQHKRLLHTNCKVPKTLKTSSWSESEAFSSQIHPGINCFQPCWRFRPVNPVSRTALRKPIASIWIKQFYGHSLKLLCVHINPFQCVGCSFSSPTTRPYRTRHRCMYYLYSSHFSGLLRSSQYIAEAAESLKYYTNRTVIDSIQHFLKGTIHAILSIFNEKLLFLNYISGSEIDECCAG